MGKYIKLYLCTFVFCILLNMSSYAQDDLLTIKQKLDRLQREVNDISKSVFSNSNAKSNINDISNDQTINFAAIDMRIYDLEKDIKGLTMNLEELIFKLDEIENKIDSLEEDFIYQLGNIASQKSDDNLNNGDVLEDDNNVNQNTLGTLKISSNNEPSTSSEVLEEENLESDHVNDTSIESKKLSPEDQFQIAFDKIRKKQYEDAKSLLRDFIANNPKNQLSGSAHYWLGELLLLEKNNREAALVLAEGYQNFPKSIKAPDMLYKLSEALFEIQKNEEACKTLSKLSKDFSGHKLKNKAEKKKIEMNCDINVE